MAEPRRIPLDSVKSLAKEKKPKDQPPTFRFCLTLDESNDKTCPEYSYSDLVKTAREDKKETVPDDPFGDDDDDDDRLREIARKYEEKYGPKIGRKNKKKFGKWEDYIDRGMGYDETDPFIDNDEAYDELVPSTLTTQYGGFYINSGELEFRAVSDSDSQVFHDEHKPRKKRRRHKEFIEKDGKKRRRLLKEGEHVPRKRGRKPADKSLSALHLPKKRRQPTVAVLLQQHKSQNLQSDQIMSTNENSFQSENEEDIEDGNPKEASISEVIESVIKAAGEDIMNNGNIMITAGSSDSDEHIRLAVEAINAPKLPDNLAPDLEEILTKLKQIAYVSEEGKCKFFSGNVNRMLLSVELKSRELPCSHRSMIYSHLASHLPCTKETLLKRAKKLRMDQEIEKLRGPLCRLKEAIGKLLPKLIEKYEAGCRLAAENRLKDEKIENEGDAKNANREGAGGEDGEKYKFPKKIFEWNDEIRQLLCELVRTKMKWYETSKMRNQSAEEYVWQFLELEVKNLWPIGWMKTINLYKESKEAHGHLTSKPKKSLILQKKPVMPLGVQVPSLPSVVNRLPSGVALSPIATGQELAEGVMSNIKVPTTSADDGESLSALIAVTTANSALLEEQKPHVLLEAQKSLILAEVQKSLITTEMQKTLISSAEMQKSLASSEDQKSLIEVKKSVVLAEAQKPLKPLEISKSLVLSETSIVPPRTISVVTTSVPLQQREKETIVPVVSAKPVIATSEIKPAVHTVQDKPSISIGQINSPNKRIFTLINSGDAAQLQAQQASQQTSLASQMLDRIICASLANFPNSGTSITDPTRYNKSAGTGRETAVEQASRPIPKSALEGIQPKAESLPVKPPSPSKIESQIGSPSSVVRPANGGVSILKSAYHNERPVIGRTLSLPEQGKILTTTVTTSTTGQPTKKFSTSSVVTNSVNTVINARKSDELKMPYHTYEFIEAFKRSLESSPEPLQSRGDSSIGHISSKAKTVVVETTRELCDEPMNYKKLQNPVDSISSLIPQDFSSKQENPTVVHLASNYKLANQVRNMQLNNPLRVHRSSPETVSTTTSFPEGMKGFPLPIKSQSTNPSCISSLSTPTPAHGLGVNRTSPAQVHEPGFTSPHRHNSPSPHRSVSAHSPSHGHPASSGSSGGHNPYQSAPLSHYPPVETAHNRSMLQSQWRVSSPSATTNFPPQYSTSNPSPSTSSPTSQTYQSPSQTSSSHHHSARVPSTTASQGSAYSHNQAMHNTSQQITPAHSTTHKTVESHLFSQQSGILASRHSVNSVWQQNPNRTPPSGQPYSNSAIVGPPGNEFLNQSRLGHHTETSFTAAPQHLLTPYHSFPLSSHSGTTQQSPHHRVP